MVHKVSNWNGPTFVYCHFIVFYYCWRRDGTRHGAARGTLFTSRSSRHDVTRDRATAMQVPLINLLFLIHYVY